MSDALTPPRTYRTDLEKCPHCQTPHPGLQLFELRAPFVHEGKTRATHWATCPELLHPLLFVVLGSDWTDTIQAVGDRSNVLVPDCLAKFEAVFEGASRVWGGRVYAEGELEKILESWGIQRLPATAARSVDWEKLYEAYKPRPSLGNLQDEPHIYLRDPDGYPYAHPGPEKTTYERLAEFVGSTQGRWDPSAGISATPGLSEDSAARFKRMFGDYVLQNEPERTPLDRKEERSASADMLLASPNAQLGEDTLEAFCGNLDKWSRVEFKTEVLRQVGMSLEELGYMVRREVEDKDVVAGIQAVQNFLRRETVEKQMKQWPAVFSSWWTANARADLSKKPKRS